MPASDSILLLLKLSAASEPFNRPMSSAKVVMALLFREHELILHEGEG